MCPAHGAREEARWSATTPGRSSRAGSSCWESERAFETPNPGRPATPTRRRSYVLEMLPYPSGELHMGHVKNYTMGDVLCHQRRRAGLAVLHPMGYDAFGLPAENAAIREGGHPREVTERNIAAIRAQMKRMGWSIDWSRELSTHEPEYYRWTQWIFLQLCERGLAYKKDVAGQVVPGRPDRAGQRAGDRRPLRALRQPGRGAHARAVVLPHHRLRRPAAGRHGAARGLARARADDAAQLDRPLARAPRSTSTSAELRGRLPRLHDAAGHAVRRDVLRARARASAGRRSSSRARSARRRCSTTCGAPPRCPRRSARRTRPRPASTRAASSSTR